ncbi:MAG TPA: hypothetical protein DIC23_02965 [Planctomycetaceae bacterium]|nr:hypothetical protein [Planctomycetaceae bacterium]
MGFRGQAPDNASDETPFTGRTVQTVRGSHDQRFWKRPRRAPFHANQRQSTTCQREPERPTTSDPFGTAGTSRTATCKSASGEIEATSLNPGNTCRSVIVACQVATRASHSQDVLIRGNREDGETVFATFAVWQHDNSTTSVEPDRQQQSAQIHAGTVKIAADTRANTAIGRGHRLCTVP